ncbi:MAG: hypothetical protein K0R62_7491 [Nonomuraea muscovyensis]|nr:hypothetical protein [Nonomuraea muscovyensis]
MQAIELFQVRNFTYLGTGVSLARRREGGKTRKPRLHKGLRPPDSPWNTAGCALTVKNLSKKNLSRFGGKAREDRPAVLRPGTALVPEPARSGRPLVQHRLRLPVVRRPRRRRPGGRLHRRGRAPRRPAHPLPRGRRPSRGRRRGPVARHRRAGRGRLAGRGAADRRHTHQHGPRPGRTPAPARHAGPARAARPRALRRAAPHQRRRLVVQRAARGGGRPLRRPGAARRAAAAVQRARARPARVRLLRVRLLRVRPLRVRPLRVRPLRWRPRLVDGAAGRGARAGTAHGPATARPAGHGGRRRAVPGGALAGRRGDGAGQDVPVHALHGAAGRLPGAAVAAQRTDGLLRRHPLRRTHQHRAGADDRLPVDDHGAEVRPVRRAGVRRAAAPHPQHGAGGAGPPRGRLRAARRRARPGARPEPDTAVPDHVRGAHARRDRRPAPRAAGRAVPAGLASGAHRPVAGPARRAGRQPAGRARLQRGAVRPGHRRTAGAALPDAARRGRRRTRHAHRAAPLAGSRRAGAARRVERHRRAAAPAHAGRSGPGPGGGHP